MFYLSICPRRSMDRTQLCGSCNVGSIPTEGAVNHVGFTVGMHLTWCHATNHKPYKIYGQTSRIKMYYVYILQSLKDKKFYIGYSENLKRRFAEHQNGEVQSTKPRRPFELIFYEAYKNMADAKRREKYFKTNKGKSSLRMMLKDSFN